jgi:hypothetical protein
MDRTPRLTAILPLKIIVGTESYTHFAHTVDISVSGVKVILPMALDPGSDVLLEYKKNRARAIVVWSKPMRRNSRDYQVGMRLLDDGQRFWLVDLGHKAHILESTGQCITERAPRSNGDRNKA